MRRSTWYACMCAVVLWAGASVLAQGQGKERVKGGPQASKAPESASAADAAAEKNVGKGKAAKQDESGTKAGGPKQDGTQGKKTGQATDEASGKGKGKGSDKKVQNEQAKHMERQARLARIRELAEKKGDKEMVARVDKLIAKEQEVYGRKQGKGPAMKQNTPPAGSKKAALSTAEPKNQGPKGQGAAQKPSVGSETKGEVKEQQTPVKPEEAKQP